MIRVSIASPQTTVEVDRAFLRQVARAVLEGEEVRQAEISLACVDNANSERLNRQYLQHAGPTDVLTFPLGTSGGILRGELVIGAEVAHAQAEEHRHSVQAELALYVIHGLLHLCGYNDHSASDCKEMRHKERHYLHALSLPDIAPHV